MTNVLVTGGAGFIGSHLVDRLLQDDQRVTVVDDFNDFYDPAIKRGNLDRHRANKNFTLIEADVTDARAIDELFSRKRFDCVVHLAARAGIRPSVADPLAYAQTNIRGTYILLEAARRREVQKFVFGSSSSVYGLASKVPFSEDTPLSDPISPYAATKISAEAACRVYSHLYGMGVVCVRLFTVYGPRQRPDLAIHKFARMISKGKPVPLFGDGSTRRDYTYVDDIVSGIVAAMAFNETAFEVINLGESQTIELRRVVELLEQALGRRALIEHHPEQPGDMPVTFADISKARALLGYSPQTGIEAGIQRFIEWFNEQQR
jgi:UDP-glucuronate 4-epimerase